MALHRQFAGHIYLGRQFSGLEFASVAPVPSAQPDRRDGAIRKHKKRLPLPPLIVPPPPSPQSLQAEREHREARRAHDSIWAKAFAPRPEAVLPVQAVRYSPRMAEELFGSMNQEAEDELLLFREELGLDAEVIL